MGSFEATDFHRSQGSPPPGLVEVPCLPRQRNGFDCGPYACAVAHWLACWVVHSQLRGGAAPAPSPEASRSPAGSVAASPRPDSAELASLIGSAWEGVGTLNLEEAEQRLLGQHLSPDAVHQLRQGLVALVEEKLKEERQQQESGSDN